MFNDVLNILKQLKYAKHLGMILCLGLGLSACTTMSGFKGPFKMFNASKPQTTVETKKREPAPHIYLSETSGMPPGWSERLHAHLSSQGKKKYLEVTRKPKTTDDLRLAGHLSAADTPKGTLIAYVWDLNDKDGNNLHRITGQKRLTEKGPRGAWSAISDETLRLIGDEATSNLQTWMLAKGYDLQPKRIATKKPAAKKVIKKPKPVPIVTAQKNPNMLSKPRIREPQAVPKQKTQASEPNTGPLPAPKKQITFNQKLKTAQTKRPRQTLGNPDAQAELTTRSTSPLVFVSAVNGASAQGNNELTRAIISSLARNGLGISPTPSQAGYKLEGKVKIEPGTVGEDEVSLVWDIKTTDGSLIGTVAQKNNIKSGSLNQAWGQTALLAADAAASRIKTVIDNRKQL